MLKELEDIQLNLVLYLKDNYLWMQEKALQYQTQYHVLEQEIYRSQKSHQNWIQFGNNNTKYFQIATTIRKRKNFI